MNLNEYKQKKLAELELEISEIADWYKPKEEEIIKIISQLIDEVSKTTYEAVKVEKVESDGSVEAFTIEVRGYNSAISEMEIKWGDFND